MLLWEFGTHDDVWEAKDKREERRRKKISANYDLRISQSIEGKKSSEEGVCCEVRSELVKDLSTFWNETFPQM
jgi:hypothetical protein